MTEFNRTVNCDILENIHQHCTEIQEALESERKKTHSNDYYEAIEGDIITLENLKKITITVRIDIRKEMIGESVELLLSIAANGFIKRKLELIPEKRIMVKEIITMLDTVHKNIKKHA